MSQPRQSAGPVDPWPGAVPVAPGQPQAAPPAHFGSAPEFSLPLHGSGSRRVLRSTTDRWIAGVSGGLAEHTGQPAVLFRVLFVVTSLIGGAGVLAYALMWLFLPLDSRAASRTGAHGRLTRTGTDLTGLLGVVALGLGVLLGLAALGAPIRVSVWAPVILVGAGVVVLWWQGDAAQQAIRPDRPITTSGLLAVWTDRGMWLRVLVGAALLLVGVLGLVVPRIDLVTLAQALLASAAVTAGVVLIALPWVAAWMRTRQAERLAAARAEERAAMAARVHDSVLQTLTLIQRRAEDPREVGRLARAEERALRSWLYAPVGPSGTLAAALAELVATAEGDYDVRVDLVTVGDLPLDDRVAALVGATREAVVNAAKHADAPVSIYAEVTSDEVEVNVKDRGRGFDPDAVSPDRHGVRESIVARVQGAGGSAIVRSAVGEGTEVRLILSRRLSDD